LTPKNGLKKHWLKLRRTVCRKG